MDKYLIRKSRIQDSFLVQNSFSSSKRIRVDFNLEILKEYPEKNSWSCHWLRATIKSTLLSEIVHNFTH